MISLRIAQFCVAAGTGALLGGTAVHLADKPKKPRIARMAPKPAAPACDPMTAQQTPAQVAAIPEAIQSGAVGARGAGAQNQPVLLSNSAVPAGRGGASTSVPEPAALALLGMGILGFAGLHAYRRKR